MAWVKSKGSPFFVRHYILSLVICLVAAPFLYWATSALAAPAEGKVVDAITGQPITGLQLTLQVTKFVGFSSETQVLASVKSQRFGRFLSSGAIFWPGFPSQVAYQVINVNQGLMSAGERFGAQNLILFDPIRMNGGEQADRNSSYFPLTITFRRQDCDGVWAAACTYEPFRLGMTIPLVPTVSDPNECRRISSPILQERCRQLVTYRAAFIQASKTHDSQIGLKLCDEVDHALYSDICRRTLHYHSGDLQAR
jgi:hypothetical protein